MLYLFWGEDTYRSRQGLHEFIGQLSGGKNRPFSFLWLTPEAFIKSFFEELLRSKNLFDSESIIVCENLLKESDTAEFLEDNLELCGRSENIFLFWEEGLELSYLEKFKRYAKKTEEFKLLPLPQIRIWLEKELKKRKILIAAGISEELIKQCGSNLWLLLQELEKYALTSKTDSLSRPASHEANLFHITDALSQKNRGQAWFLFQRALMAGAEEEEIFWKIVWQIKNLLIIKKFIPAPEKKIVETNRLHPFVVKKTLSAAKHFTEEELANYSSELINLYHNSRRGLADFETGIEKFLIKL